MITASSSTSSSSPLEPSGMSGAEIRASASLASIFALRMLGLFLFLPIFAVYAKTLPDGANASLVGLAMGMYGLAQSFGQIPFGIASDKYGRKRIIVIGLVLFALGSFMAAFAGSVFWIMIGRAVQGAGAISAAITAFIADSTREQHRTKAMAMVGAAIGLTFAASMVLAPLLFSAIGMSGIFVLTGVLSLAAIGVVLFLVPDAPMVKAKRVPLMEVLRHGELMRLNVGVFVLHMGQVAMFMVIPAALIQSMGLPVEQHWKVYLPVVLLSFVLMLPPVFIGEKYGRMKQVFVAAILLLLAVQAGMWFALSHGMHWGVLVALLLAFFIAFNVLEACQPSLVSRIAPPAAKGTALGVYNTLQSLGLFTGGAVGGLLRQHEGAAAVFIMCSIATLGWLLVASGMKHLPVRAPRPAANASGGASTSSL